MKNLCLRKFLSLGLLLLGVHASDTENIDSDWMSYIENDQLRLNELNIPGTHDTGTFNIGITKFFGAQTQNLNITEQLEHGIRYLDVRVGYRVKESSQLYINHNGIKCKDDNNDIYYLNVLLDSCISFLQNHKNETVIIHLKDEDVEEYLDKDGKKHPYDISSVLANYTVLKTSNVSGKNDPYNNYFYNFTDDKMPTLNEAKGKIVLLTRKPFSSKNGPIGYHVDVPYMGKCDAYTGLFKDGKICYPVLTKETRYRFQDNYSLEKEDKWELIDDLLSNNLPSRDNNNDPNLYSKEVTNRFYSPNPDLLTINFMNVARVDTNHWWHVPLDFISDSSLLDSANYINKHLIDFDTAKHPFYNTWFIMDYPSTDVIRKVFLNNKFKSNIKLKPSSKGYTWVDSLYYFIDSFSHQIHFGKRENQNQNQTQVINVCLQRVTVTDEHGKRREVVKTNYKCVNNRKNKWYVKSIGKYQQLISAYDKRCLSYDANGVFNIKKCNNSKSQQFSINEGHICPSSNSKDCLDGIFEPHPVALELNKYENLTCSSKFSRLGYKCCSNQNARIEKIDRIGNWGKENGKWCGIGYFRCSFEILGYPCCMSAATEVVEEDEVGKWGFEDGQRCGIGELKRNPVFHIRNRKSKDCLVVDDADGSIPALGDCGDAKYSGWYFRDNQIISVKNKKCLYAINAKDPKLGDCGNVYNQKAHYKYFDINTNGNICVLNHVADDAQFCLNGKDLIFENLNGQYSEWEVKDMDGNDSDVITNVPGYQYNPNRKHDPVEKPSFNDDSCWSEALSDPYPCCSNPNAKVVYTDRHGTWGIENKNWCGLTEAETKLTCFSEHLPKPSPCCANFKTKITYTDKNGNWGVEDHHWCGFPDDVQQQGEEVPGSNPVPVPEPEPVTTDINDRSYYLYNANLDKCIYTSGILGSKITLAPCDKSYNTFWYIPDDHNGHYRSVLNPNYCIQVKDKSLVLGQCVDADYTIFYRQTQSIQSASLRNRCVGLANSAQPNLSMNLCSDSNPDQVFYYNFAS